MKKLLVISPLIYCVLISCQDKQAISELEELNAQAKLEEQNKAIVEKLMRD